MHFPVKLAQYVYTLNFGWSPLSDGLIEASLGTDTELNWKVAYPCMRVQSLRISAEWGFGYCLRTTATILKPCRGRANGKRVLIISRG